MTYRRHKWQKKDPISADRLNNIEDGIEEALKLAIEPGPQGESGEKGEKGDAGEQGAPGIGLTGEAKTVKVLPANAELPAVIEKVNELIALLKNRGVSA